MSRFDTVQIDVDREQLRELERRISDIEGSTVSDITETVTEEVIPSLVNFADNSDFIFSDKIYNVNGSTYLTYTDDINLLAHWYGKSQSSSTAWVENASASESTESIRNSSHGSGARTGFEWNNSEGTLLLTGGYKVGSRLHLKHANSGNYMVARMQLSRVLGKAAPTSNIKLKVSLFDNDAGILSILKGSKPALSSNYTGIAGAITRQYILEIQMSDGRTFYSNVSAFGASGTNQIINTSDTSTISSSNYVTISWDSTIIGAVRYNVYRRQTTGDTTWYLISSITNGSNIANDYGGIGGGAWTVPSFTPDHDEYQYARGFVSNIGERLQIENNVQEVAVDFYVPYNFIPTGNQFIQIEFVKSDYSDTTATEIAADAIRIDRVGLSYANGRWSPSARDINISGNPPTTIPPPTGGGGGDIEPPHGCVEEHSLILCWSANGNHLWRMAKEIVQGDRLVSWDYVKKEFAPSTVIAKPIKGVSIKNYELFGEKVEETLVQSFSHEIISNMENFKHGSKVRFLPETILRYEGKEIVLTNIESWEILNSKRNVITFIQEKNRENYIANGYFCHNKPIFT